MTDELPDESELQCESPVLVWSVVCISPCPWYEAMTRWSICLSPVCACPCSDDTLVRPTEFHQSGGHTAIQSLAGATHFPLNWPVVRAARRKPALLFRVSGINGDTQGIRAGAPLRSLAAIVTTVCSEVGQHCCFSNLFTRRTGKKAKRLLLDQLVCWSAEWHLSARSVVMVLALEVQLFANAGKVDPDNSSR